MTDLSVTPVTSDPTLDGDHERMAHIVLEGWTPKDGDYVSAGPTVVEGLVNGTAVKALCGKIWVPSRDPKRYPVCPTCKEIAESRGVADPGALIATLIATPGATPVKTPVATPATTPPVRVPPKVTPRAGTPIPP